MIRLSVESKLLVMLLFVSIASILAISVITYTGSEAALKQAVYNQLTSLRASRKTQVEDLFKTVRLQASNLANFQTIVDMTNGLRQGVTDLQKEDISPAMDAALAAYYRNQFLPALEDRTGREPILEAYFPHTAAARYLQYWYEANNPDPVDQKYKLNDAGDGSLYSSVHRSYQPIIAKYVLDFGYSNMFLVDSQTGDVIYGFAKTPILGTNLLTGPYADTNAALLFRSLAHEKNHNTVSVVDFAPFAPAQGQPVALAGTPVFDGADEIGVLFIQFPVDATNRIMTGDAQWERDGLGETGEAYLVGPDMLMRSRSRLLWQNPLKFYDELAAADYPADEIERVKRGRTATLNQRAQTMGVQLAMAGHQGTLIDTNYLGKRVLTSYAPLSVPGLHWVIVADMETREAFAPLNALARRILISTVIIILLVSMLAVLLGRLFVRPLYRLIARVREMNSGQAEVMPEPRSRDEFGDLAAAFDIMHGRLKNMAGDLQRTRQQHDGLLSRLFPAPAAARIRAGQAVPGERFDDASVLFAEFTGLTTLTASMPPEPAIRLLGDLVNSIDDAAVRFGVEKLRTVGGSYLAVSGLPIQRLDHANRMLDFAQELRRLARHLRSDRGVAVAVRIGITSGPVLCGMIGEVRPTFDIWGEAVDLSKAIASAGDADTVLVSGACHDLLHDLYEFDPPVELALAYGRRATVWPLRPEAEDHRRTAPAMRAASPTGQAAAHE